MLRQKIQVIAPLLTLLSVSACGEESGSVPAVSEEELTAQVAELDAIHEVMVPMWHEAFPARDFAAIRSSVTDFEPLFAALDEAMLPGILQDKQAQWEEGKARVLASFQELKSAAEAGEEEGMLGPAEALHMNYEAMVRIIRPVVPELQTFHRHLYGVYHYYGPAYDLEKIRAGADSMAAAIPPLQVAQLPSRLEGRKADFQARVETLGDRVAGLLVLLDAPSRGQVQEAIEAVHTAYQSVEDVFN